MTGSRLTRGCHTRLQVSIHENDCATHAHEGYADLSPALRRAGSLPEPKWVLSHNTSVQRLCACKRWISFFLFCEQHMRARAVFCWGSHAEINLLYWNRHQVTGELSLTL